MAIQSRKVMMAAANNGRTFYVDAISGNDINDGLATARAWQTITKVNSASLLPGDHVLFKKGQTFTGPIVPSCSGATNKYIKYGAYGSGNIPIINGASSTALQIESSDFHHLRFENIDFSGSTGIYSTVYCYNTHDIYFCNCIMRDAGVRHGASISSTGSDIYNITVDSCTIHDNYMSGILCAYVHSQNIIIKNCTAYTNGHSTSGDHGFYIGGGTTLENCVAYSNAGGGIKLNDNEVEPTQYPVSRNNKSYSNNYGIIVTHKNASVYNNLVYSNTNNMAVYGNAWGGYKIYFNTFVNSTSATTRSITFSAGISANSIIKNNIFIQDSAIVSKGNLHFDTGLGIGDYAGMFDYNVYYFSSSSPTTQHIIYSADDVGTELKDWTEWQAAGAEAHGTLLTAVPGFVARYTNLQPMNGGNLIGLGVALVGYSTDYSGTVRTDPPTPGCYDDPKPEQVTFVSAEIGNVAASTVVVTFSTTILASNYSTGVIIKINGSAATINSATRQANTKVVYFVLSTDVIEGNTLTWEYAADSGNYTNSAATYNLPDTSAQSVTNNVVNTLSNISHETNNLSQYSSTSIDSGNMVASAAAALNNTSYGAAHTFNGTNITYGQMTYSNISNGKCRIRFYFDPNSFTGTDATEFMLLNVRNSIGNNVLVTRIYRQTTNPYRLYIKLYNDAAGSTNSTVAVLTDAPHYIEINIVRATTSSSSDGSAQFWLDGISAGTITGVDNFDQFDQLADIRIGKQTVGAGFGGTFYIDEIKVNNSGSEIGA